MSGASSGAAPSPGRTGQPQCLLMLQRVFVLCFEYLKASPLQLARSIRLVGKSTSPMPLRFRGKYMLTPASREGAITCAAFSVHGDYIAIGGLDRKLHVFSLDNGQLHYSVGSPGPIKSLIWLPGTEQTLVCACHGGILMNVVIRPGVSTSFMTALSWNLTL